MQQGNARPLAVMYIRDHGRRHSDHGEFPSEFLKLMPGSEAAPEALNTPEWIIWDRHRTCRLGSGDEPDGHSWCLGDMLTAIEPGEVSTG